MSDTENSVDNDRLRTLTEFAKSLPAYYSHAEAFKKGWRQRMEGLPIIEFCAWDYTEEELKLHLPPYWRMWLDDVFRGYESAVDAISEYERAITVNRNVISWI